MDHFISENQYAECERHRRWLAGEESVRVDYSVLSVGVMTLGLIMIVEVIRHRLDHAAAPRPFSKAVLQGVYSELATLGIVELLLFMLSKYYNDLDKEKYLVFADIHFSLFYTAILNAFQSVILAIGSHRVARQIWVQTEMLELSHYVEIREEFDQVKAAMERMGATSDSGPSLRAGASSGRLDSVFTGKSVFKSFLDRFRYPTLRRRYNELLIQVRFHELRVHFLQAYNLPLTMKVSDYLLESQQQVLLKLVHVSSIAWTLLTGAVNAMYYVLGIVSYKVADSTIVGTALIWIFFWSMGVFVIIAAAVYRKMESIFKKIMIEKTLWGLKNQQSDRDRLRDQQVDLFWGSDPKLVIAAIQFMQFGFAVNLSVVIIFWQEIDDGRIPMVAYLLVIAVCYTVFVYVTARVIPQYTMCTNLGQLVDEKRLHETLAVFVLEESQRQEADEKVTKKFSQTLMMPNERQSDSNLNQRDRTEEQKFLSESKSVLLSTTNDTSSTSNHSVSNAVLMAELVKLDTNSLRMNLPSEERNKITFRQMERTSRRGRQKSLSEGIAAMVSMGNMPFPDLSAKPNHVKDDLFLAESKEWKRPGYRFEPSEKLKAEDTSQDSLARRRRSHRRLKTVSDGVAAMARLPVDVVVNGLSPVPEYYAHSPIRKDLAPFDANQGSEAPTTDSIAQVPYNTEMDHSVHSDGGHSDIDDVPDVDFKGGHHSLPVPATTLKKRFKKFILSKKYVVFSNVFGTLVAFFLVGQRVESFLHSEGIVSEKFVSFDFNHEHTFWTLFVLFSLFCIVDCAIMMTLNPLGQLRQSSGEKKALIAALIDFLLMSLCLSLFILAEVKRCCTENDSDGLASKAAAGNFNSFRLLAAVSSKSEHDDYHNSPAPCACPQFGHRMYGGLGRIEPFTAFVGLRIFRHWVAGHIMKHLLSYQQGKLKEDGVAEGISSDPFAFFGKSHQAPREEIRGTAAELWKAVIGEHPEVAHKYGAFSCEILKIMLGMSISDSNISDSAKEGSRAPTLPDDKSSSFKLGNAYAGSAPKTQEGLVAVALGRSFKHESMAFESMHGSIPDDEEAARPHNDGNTLGGNLSSEIVFRSPGAQLVRSMRRCDRKLLPILNKWAAVDAVLTRFEIVYFEVLNAGNAAPESDDMKAALRATKGGKGLRLCDVAKGRRIIGRLEISDIESVTVQRYISAPETADLDRNGADAQVATVEFWKDSSISGVRFPRSFRWSQIKQDQLHVKTIHGRTLCLRFYSDLETAEQSEQHSVNNATIQKNNAFQWVQTIGRFCGPDQLKQQLPHFGDSTDDELRDYLVEHQNLQEQLGKLGHRRISSTGDLRGLLGRKAGQQDNSTNAL